MNDNNAKQTVTFIYLYCLSNTGAGHPYFNATLFMHMVDIFKHYLKKSDKKYDNKKNTNIACLKIKVEVLKKPSI